jgi:DnaJ like chaperone protein
MCMHILQNCSLVNAWLKGLLTQPEESTMVRRNMSIWSRLTHTISAIGDSIVAFLARLASGRATPPEKTLAFTIGLIALGAKMAKADGIVTSDEVAAFKRIFRVPQEELAGVARVFNLAKQDVAGYQAYARQLARLFAGGHQILEDILDSLFSIAKADGAVHERELGFLEDVATIFGFDAKGFARIEARHVMPEGTDPYAILGIERGARDEEIKKRYRKLVREYHPDVHIAGGMPEELIDLANERLARINAAYDEIARERVL